MPQSATPVRCRVSCNFDVAMLPSRCPSSLVLLHHLLPPEPPGDFDLFPYNLAWIGIPRRPARRPPLRTSLTIWPGRVVHCHDHANGPGLVGVISAPFTCKDELAATARRFPVFWVRQIPRSCSELLGFEAEAQPFKGCFDRNPDVPPRPPLQPRAPQRRGHRVIRYATCERGQLF